MADKRELLALLAARGLSPGHVAGGMPTLTQLEIAGMMAPLSKCECALLRAKYAIDAADYHRFWAYWFEYLMGQGWVTKKPGAIEALSMITWREQVSANRCGLCDGTWGWPVENKWRACPCCAGHGVVYMSNREVARGMGFKDEGLKAPWPDRLDWARRQLVHWDDCALDRMIRLG